MMSGVEAGTGGANGAGDGEMAGPMSGWPGLAAFVGEAGPQEPPARSRYEIADQQHQGMTVAAFEHPADWVAGSQVVWNFQNSSQPVLVHAYTAAPDGSEVLEFLPVEGCCWVQPNYGMTVGQARFGLTLLPPYPALDALVQWLIPRYRGNRPGLRLVGSGPVPDLAARLGAVELRDVPHEGVMARIEYEDGGRTIAEELYSCRYLFAPIPGQVVQQNWGFTRTFCFRAERDRLDACQARFQRIAASLFYNQGWLQLSQQIVQQLHGQFVQNHQARMHELADQARFQQELSAFYQQQRDNQNANIAAGIAHQQDVNAARWAPAGGGGGQSAGDAWGDELLGRAAYVDPNSTTGNHHYDYGHHETVWTDGQGNFVGGDLSFDPNQTPTDRHWVRAERA